MSTKCKVIGKKGSSPRVKKPIDFIYDINRHDGLRNLVTITPSIFDNIELIAIGDEIKYDVMFAYNIHRKEGKLYLGHWNDGIIEN